MRKGAHAVRGVTVLISMSILVVAGTIGGGAVAAPGAVAVAPPAVHPVAHATAAALRVTPSTGLVDNQATSIVATGLVPGTTYVAVDCGPKAYTLLEDGCDNRHDSVLFVDGSGVLAGTLAVQAILSTADGPVDCRTAVCAIAIFALYQPAGGPSLLIQNVSFSSSACSAPGACRLPAVTRLPNPQATPAVTTAPSASTTTASTTAPSARLAHGAVATITPAVPDTFTVSAGLAGDLTLPGAVTGPTTGPLGGSAPPATPVSGEGLIRLALAAPGTSWGPGTPSSVVVDVSVDGGIPQQLVLFDGASTFTYAGFVGPLTTGSHQVTITVEPPSGPAASTTANPVATLVDSELEVIAPSNPSYLAYAYAPIMYGRTTSALHDTPLIAYASSQAVSGGSTQLTYTVVWSHEDAGTGFVPFLESGSWGRLSDIENAISFTVAPDGSVSNATYLYGGEPLTGALDSLGATSETDVPFTGSFDGHHPIIRDATGNNDFSDEGTTGFRFQQALVAAPGPGQAREEAMDANPWTYRITGEEIARWYGDISTNPLSPQPGDSRQYAIVDLNTSGSGVSSVDVQLQLGGTWYSSDLGSGYPLVGTGHVRTVVKMPMGWQGQPVTGVRIGVLPASAAPSVTVTSLTVEQLANDWSLSTLSLPAPTVVPETVAIPPALSIHVTAPATIAPSAAFAPGAVVTDSLGDPIAAITAHADVSGALAFGGCGEPASLAPRSTASGSLALPRVWGHPSGGSGALSLAIPEDPVSGTTVASVSVAGTRAAGGYRLIDGVGRVEACGGSTALGSAPAPLAAPVVGAASSSGGTGYWLVGADGGVFSFGSAGFHGSMGAKHLNAPIVGMAAAPDGNGYWLVGADGGVFSFGSAGFHGSMGGTHLNAPIVGMAAAPGGNGYWLVGADGGVFSFGTAGFHGSMGGKRLNAPIVGMAAAPDGNGYWLVGANGGVFSFGSAGFGGALAGTQLSTGPSSTVGITSP